MSFPDSADDRCNINILLVRDTEAQIKRTQGEATEWSTDMQMH
jgi:hypothetical protein